MYQNRLKCPQEFSNDEFKIQVVYFYKKFTLQLKSFVPTNELYLEVDEPYKEYFIAIFNQILHNFEGKNVYSNLPDSKTYSIIEVFSRESDFCLIIR